MYNPQVPTDGHSPAAETRFGNGAQAFDKSLL
jgi:hypothetical protein